MHFFSGGVIDNAAFRVRLCCLEMRVIRHSRTVSSIAQSAGIHNKSYGAAAFLGVRLNAALPCR